MNKVMKFNLTYQNCCKNLLSLSFFFDFTHIGMFEFLNNLKIFIFKIFSEETQERASICLAFNEYSYLVTYLDSV